MTFCFLTAHAHGSALLSALELRLNRQCFARWRRGALACWWLVLLASLVPQPAGGQPAAWHREPVLSRLLVQQMATDAAGLRWLATDEGVYRYDGYETVALQRLVRQGPRLPVEMVSALTFDGAGRLWLGSATGLYCFEPGSGVLRKVPLAPDFHAGVAVHALLWHPRTNRLWVGHGLELLVLDPARPARPLAKLVLPADRDPTGLFTPERASGAVWFSSKGHELYQLDPDAAVRQHFLVDDFAVPVVGTRPQRFVTRQALLEAAGPGPWRALLRWPGGPEQIIRPWMTDTTVDFVTLGYRVQLRQPGGAHPQVQREQLRFSDDAPQNQTYYLLEQGPLGVWWCYSRIWRGCYLQRPVRAVVQAVPLVPSPGPGSARAIRRLATGRLLVSTYAGLFAQAADSPQAPLRPLPMWERRGGRTRPIKPTFMAMLPTADPQRLVVLDEGLGYGLFTPATGEISLLAAARPLPSQALLHDQAGQWWGGGQAGLCQPDLARGVVRSYAVQPLAGRLKSLTVWDMAEDPANRALWLATNGGLWWYRPADHALRHFGVAVPAPRTLPTDALLTVLAMGPGRAWLGTRDQGLLEVDLHRGLLRQVNEAQGLPSHTVASLLPGAGGQLWAGTYAGIVRYDPTREQLAVFGESEGMHNAELNRHSALVDADGSLWMGGLGGVYHLRPEQLRPGAAPVRPRLLVTGVGQTVGGQLHETPVPAAVWPRLTLPAAPEAAVAVQLAFTDFFAPELVRYFYRLRPANGAAPLAWQATPHRLVLRGLSPGDYDLEVRAENQLGQPAANRLHLPLRVQAAWWQLPVVWGLAAALLVALGYGAYGLRLRRERREAAHRAELAANLHDEVGALLTRVSMLAEVLSENHSTIEPNSHAGHLDTRHALDRLLYNSRAAVQTMRDVVWGIDSRADSVAALLDRMREHLSQTAAAAGLQATFTHADLSEKAGVPASVRQHLYLVFKEAVTNAARHAQAATEIRVYLGRRHGQLVLEVGDDGQDIGPTSRSSGMGLRNMARRAQAMGATLHTGPHADGRPGYCVRLALDRA